MVNTPLHHVGTARRIVKSGGLPVAVIGVFARAKQPAAVGAASAEQLQAAADSRADSLAAARAAGLPPPVTIQFINRSHNPALP